jgi:excisionase family DNA binding protein
MKSEVAPLPEIINSDRWISLQEVCEYLGVKRHTILRWIEQRDMPASKVGKLWRFKTADIDKWVRKGGTSDKREVMK